MTTLVARNGGLLIKDGGLAAADDPCVCCTPPCGTSAESGGAGVTVNTYAYPSDEGEVEFFYDAYSVPDAFKVEGGGKVFVDTGSVSGSATIRFCKPAGLKELTVTVTGPDGTAWNYTIGCPDNPCGESGACVWKWDATGAITGGDPAWYSPDQTDPCAPNGTCPYPSFPGDYDGQEITIDCVYTHQSAYDHEPTPEELRRATERLQQSLNNPLP